MKRNYRKTTDSELRTQPEEDRAIRRLRIISDITCHTLSQQSTSLGEALQLIFQARRQALQMFPEKAATFDMIYGRRFVKILESKGAFFHQAYPFWN